MSISKGQRLTEVSRKSSWDAQGGWQSEIIYVGTEAACQGEIPGLQAQGFTQIVCEKIGNGPRYQLIARTATDVNNPNPGDTNLLVNTHELLSEELSHSILANEQFLSLHSPYSVEAVLAITRTKARMDQGAFGDDAAVAYSDATGVITAWCLSRGLTNEHALGAFDDLIKGNDTYFKTAYVYRRTITVGSGAQLAHAFSNINRKHTTAQVIDAEGPMPPAFPLPSGVVWFKKGPNNRASLRQFSQIQYEYTSAVEMPDRYYLSAT